jgi:hypothetical protein
MGDQENGHGKSRLDRIEEIMEVLANRQALIEDEFTRLLKAQVVMFDSMTTLTKRVDQLATRMDQLAEAQKHTDERLNALITVVDGIVRGPQPPRT